MVTMQVSWKGTTTHFYMQYLGAKGDWPWLRSAYRLATGFTSTRICHRCHGRETRIKKLNHHLILLYIYILYRIYIYIYIYMYPGCK